MPTPEIVIDLFSDEQMIILAWLHFLVMDTFAGRYVWLRMVEKDKPSTILCQYCFFVDGSSDWISSRSIDYNNQ